MPVASNPLQLPQQPVATPAVATSGPPLRPTHEEGDDDLYLPADPTNTPPAPPPTPPPKAPTPALPATPPSTTPHPLFLPSAPPSEVPDNGSPTPPEIVCDDGDQVDKASLDVTANVEVEKNKEDKGKKEEESPAEV